MPFIPQPIIGSKLSTPARRTAMVMRITPSETERNARAFSSATLGTAAQCMRTEGALILEDIVDTALILEERQTLIKKYDRYFDGQKHNDALEVGERRQMITLDLEPPFNRRELIANSWLCPVLHAAFEDDFILDAYGVVCSLPGAPRQ